MTEESGAQPPSWWLVDRRAAKRAEREERRDERGARRAARRAGGAADRSPVTPERIADAALGIIDQAGVEALTVRALANALGVGTMTLYWYVQDKEEVLDLVADRLLAGIVVPETAGDWRTVVAEIARGVRRGLLAHPGAVALLATRGSFGPSALGLLEASLAILRSAGFDAEGAAYAYATLSDYVVGFCVSETSARDFRQTPAGQATIERAGQYVGQLSPDRYPNILAAAPSMFGGSRDARFAFGLECLVDGLSERLARSDTATQGRNG